MINNSLSMPVYLGLCEVSNFFGTRTFCSFIHTLFNKLVCVSKKKIVYMWIKISKIYKFNEDDWEWCCDFHGRSGLHIAI